MALLKESTAKKLESLMTERFGEPINEVRNIKRKKSNKKIDADRVIKVFYELFGDNSNVSVADAAEDVSYETGFDYNDVYAVLMSDQRSDLYWREMDRFKEEIPDY